MTWMKSWDLYPAVVFSYLFYEIFLLLSDVLPCFGELPIVDESSGLEYNCGLYGAECPKNSYCHQTANFAKCCPKGMSINVNVVYLRYFLFHLKHLQGVESFLGHPNYSHITLDKYFYIFSAKSR